MKKVVSTKDFWPVNQKNAEEILVAIKHVYGECSSVCDLADNDLRMSELGEIGIIDLDDLGLIEGPVTMQDIIEKSLKQGYSKITFSEIINYIGALRNIRWGNDFGSEAAIMALMDEVVDQDGISGIVYLQPNEEGLLYRLGFLDQPNYSKPLLKKVRLLAKKLTE
jgi:hypothetical protein